MNSRTKEYRLIKQKEPEVSRVMRLFASENGYCLYGFKNRVKTFSSACDKLRRKKRHHLTDLNDMIRYTILVQEHKYGETVSEAICKIQEYGVQINKVKNYWTDHGSPYNGINVQAQYNGTKFEIQFHTYNSVEVNKTTHALYEESRRLHEMSLQLNERRREIARSQAKPAGCETIESFNWK